MTENIADADQQQDDAEVITEAESPRESDSPCLVRYQPHSHVSATCRLYCVPFAGGSSQVFASWATSAPSGVDVVAIELPGRGGRMDEAIPSSDVDDQTELAAIASAITQDAGSIPFVLCGMSMGALIATELAMALSKAGSRQGPRALLLVGRVPPTFTSYCSELPVETYILASEAVQQSEAWATIFLPMLKADLAMDARFALRVRETMSPTSSALSLRIEVHCGISDPSFPCQRLTLSLNLFDFVCCSCAS